MTDTDKSIYERLDNPPRNTFRYGAFSMLVLIIGLIYLLFGIQITINKHIETISGETIRLDNDGEVLLLSKIAPQDTTFLKSGRKLVIRFGNGSNNQSVEGFVQKEIHNRNDFSDILIALKGEITAGPIPKNEKSKKINTTVFRYLVENILH